MNRQSTPSLLPASARFGHRGRAVLLLILWSLAGLVSPADAAAPRSEVEALIEGLVELIRDNYVLPERVDEIETSLRDSLRSGRYAAAADPQEISERIMADLRESSRDLHFGIRPKPPISPSSAADTSTKPSASEASSASTPSVSGLGRVETMPRNVGFIAVIAFPDPALAAEAVDAAFDRLADSSAIILDLRHSRGGHPGMVAYLLSYFFDEEPFVFNRLEWSASEKIIEFETVADLPSPRFVDRPVFILTSRHTPSAAEGFTYHMKHLRRARVVGERTAGAAHLAQAFELDGFQIAIPTGRPLSPITGSNWEGTGVAPDHEVPADRALEIALELATKRGEGP